MHPRIKFRKLLGNRGGRSQKQSCRISISNQSYIKLFFFSLLSCNWRVLATKLASFTAHALIVSRESLYYCLIKIMVVQRHFYVIEFWPNAVSTLQFLIINLIKENMNNTKNSGTPSTWILIQEQCEDMNVEQCYCRTSSTSYKIANYEH